MPSTATDHGSPVVRSIHSLRVGIVVLIALSARAGLDGAEDLPDLPNFRWSRPSCRPPHRHLCAQGLSALYMAQLLHHLAHLLHILHPPVRTMALFLIAARSSVLRVLFKGRYPDSRHGPSHPPFRSVSRKHL